MKGVLRTMLLFYTSSKAQPWLVGIGLAVFIASHSEPYTTLCKQLSWSPMWTALASVLSLALMGVALALGTVGIRRVSSLRVLTLIPFARVRLLLGLLLAPMLPAALIVISVVLQNHGVSRGWGSPRGTVEIVCASALLATMWLFLAARSTVLGLLPSILGLALLALTRNPLMRSEIAGLPVADILSCIALASVFIFAAWYLSAQYIEPPKAAGLEGFASARIRPAEAIRASGNAAINAYLLDAPSIPSAARPLWALSAFFNVLFLIMFGMAWHNSHGRLGFTSAPLVTLFSAITLGNQWVMKIAQRSRRIWLNSGETRLGVFHICEQLSWKFFAASSAPLFLACIIEWIVLPQGTVQLHGNGTGLYLLLVMLELNVCGIYFGLRAFRNRPADQIPFVLVLTTVYLTVMVYLPIQTHTPPALLLDWSIALALLIGALIMRQVARARWQDIDWLNCRPKRKAERAFLH